MKTQIKNNLGHNFTVEVTWVHATKMVDRKPKYTQCKVKIINRATNEENSFQAISRCSNKDMYNKRIGRRLSFKKVMQYDNLKEKINKENRRLIFKNFFSLSKKDAHIFKGFYTQEDTTKKVGESPMMVVA